IAVVPTVTAAPSRRRKGVVIRDPKETTTTSTIIHSEAKSKDKGKGILVEEPKPLKKQDQIKQDKKYARELVAELNKNKDWDEVIDHVHRKAKEDNAVKRYQALKRKPQTEAQARKNMMIYLKNKFNSNVAFLPRTKEQIDEEVSEVDENVEPVIDDFEELKKCMEIVLDDGDEVIIEATPLSSRSPTIIDYKIYKEGKKTYFKIIRAD
nr:hypothetical protein [Tanacetum cinerariifolium]